MAYTTVGDQLPIHILHIQFLLEPGNHVGGDKRIPAGVQYQQLGPNLRQCLVVRRRQYSMEADYAVHIGTAVGQLQHGAATETVADGGDIGGIHIGMSTQDLDALHGPLAPPFDIRRDHVVPGLGLIRIVGVLAATVHIHGEGDIAQFGEMRARRFS